MKRTTARPSNHVIADFTRRRGIVLFLVLVVTVLLALAAYGFVIAIQSDHRLAKINADRIHMQHLLASGETAISVWLEQPRSARYDSDTQLPLDITKFSITTTDTTEVTPVGTIQLNKSPSMSVDEVSAFQDSSVARGVSNEPSSAIGALESPMMLINNHSAKLHLGTILAWEKQQAGTGRAALMRLPAMTESIADAILDWLDEDEAPREFGAEQSYYAAQASGYVPRNGIPSQLEELLFIRDVTTDLLFGAQAVSANGAPMSDMLPTTAGAVDDPLALAGGWDRYLTVISAERNETWSGHQRIFVNDANLTQLYQTLVDRVPTNVANFVVAYRQFGPTATQSTENQVADYTPDLTRPATHNLTSLVELIDAAVAIGGADEGPKLVLASPFSRQTGGDATALGHWLDALTIDQSPRIDGRINVVDASEEVLLAIPGMEPTLLQFVIEQRQSPTARENLMWFWSTNVVPHATIEQIERWLTVGGDVVDFSIQVRHSPSGLERRGRMVLDAAGPATRRLAFVEQFAPDIGPASPASPLTPTPRTSPE